MSRIFHVGNDILDLRDPRLRDKHHDLRFIRRIFAPEEASRILSATEPNRLLWLMWAAKEAAFKVVSKEAERAPVFRHASFVTCLEPGGDDEAATATLVRGTVTYEGAAFPFRGDMNQERIHAVSWSWSENDEPAKTISTGEAAVGGTAVSLRKGSAGFDILLQERFTLRERRSIHGPKAAYARLLARRAVADTLKMDESRLEIVCGPEPTGRTPPRLLLDGQPSLVDVSISHHGSLVAWAFAAEPV